MGDNENAAPRRWLYIGGVLLLLLVTWGMLEATRYDGRYPITKVGTIGEWLSGVGTIAAILVGFALNRRDANQRAEELFEQQEAERATRRATEVDRRVAAARSLLIYQTGFDAVEEWGGDGTWRCVLRGKLGNFSTEPVRVVRLELLWTPLAAGTRRVNANDVAEIPTIETLASALPPSAVVDVAKEGGDEIAYIVPFKPGLNGAVASLNLRFFDVHGDEWLANFGPGGNQATVERIASNSEFWQEDD